MTVSILYKQHRQSVAPGGLIAIGILHCLPPIGILALLLDDKYAQVLQLIQSKRSLLRHGGRISQYSESGESTEIVAETQSSNNFHWPLNILLFYIWSKISGHLSDTA